MCWESRVAVWEYSCQNLRKGIVAWDYLWESSLEAMESWVTIHTGPTSSLLVQSFGDSIAALCPWEWPGIRHRASISPILRKHSRKIPDWILKEDHIPSQLVDKLLHSCHSCPWSTQPSKVQRGSWAGELSIPQQLIDRLQGWHFPSHGEAQSQKPCKESLLRETHFPY